MNDESLYREELMALVKDPVHKGKPVSSTISHDGVNPMCGDELTLYLQIEQGNIVDMSYEGEACAVCLASSEVLSDDVIGKPVDYIENLSKDDLLNMLGVNLTTSRVKCASLPLDTIKEAVRIWQNSNK